MLLLAFRSLAEMNFQKREKWSDIFGTQKISVGVQPKLKLILLESKCAF